MISKAIDYKSSFEAESDKNNELVAALEAKEDIIDELSSARYWILNWLNSTPVSAALCQKMHRIGQRSTEWALI